ncbi:hypothetical protein KKF55_00880 [Patescibacteria group bacterium]|nr:hypothetical protein [Patescibacteria group bacterium]
MLEKARRLPKRFRRPVTKETKNLLRRKHKKQKKQHWKDVWHRIARRNQRIFRGMWKSLAWWLAIFFVGLLMLGIGLVTFSPLVKIREVRIQRSNARLDIEEVQRVLTPFFGRHLFFLPSYEVSMLLFDSIQDVKNVKVYKNYPSQLLVNIELDPLYARLNILDPDEELVKIGTGAIVDFLTDQGVYVVAQLQEKEKALPLIRLVDWGVRPIEGDKMVNLDFLVRVRDTERSLSEQFGHSIETRTIFLRAQEYHLSLDNGLDLWFDTRSKLEDQLLRYRTFLRSIDLESVEDYIDLRLSDRVVYK